MSFLEIEVRLRREVQISASSGQMQQELSYATKKQLPI